MVLTDLAAITKLFRLFTGDASFNRICNNLSVVSATEKCLTCRFQVTKPVTNSVLTLHGGYITTATDIVSSADIFRYGPAKHVSVHLGVEFLKPGVYESWIKVDSYVLQLGKRMAFCDVHFIDEASGNLLARGTHTKYIIDNN